MLNAHVKRAQRIPTEEFYELTHADATVAAIRNALMQREWIYNNVRHHQALDYKLLTQFLGIST